MSYVLTCDAASYTPQTCTATDPETSECTAYAAASCSAPMWIEEPTLLPELSAADGAMVGLALFGCMFTAFLLRLLFRFAREQ